MARWVFVAIGLGQSAVAQLWLGPSQSRSLSSVESAQLSSAMDMAEMIAGSQTGRQRSEAFRDVFAVRIAVSAWRVGALKPPNEGGFASDPRGYTWPDLPPCAKCPKGEYVPGQTPIQYVAFGAQDLASLCPCAMALVVLHEGHRLNFSLAHPGPSPVQPPTQAWWQAVTSATLAQGALAIEDLENLAAARSLMPCADPDCARDLTELEHDARAYLEKVNGAIGECMQAGQPVAPLVPPYPPTYQ